MNTLNPSSASVGVSQPDGATLNPSSASVGASHPDGPGTLVEFPLWVKLGTFNFGLYQSQLEKKNNVPVLSRLRRVYSTCLQEGELDMMFGCEVGGHRQGLPTAGITLREVFEPVMTSTADCHATQNYIVGWNLKEAVDVSTPKIALAGRPTVRVLSSEALDPQLVTTVFQVSDCRGKGHGYLVTGNLHIRTASGTRPPSTKTKRRQVTEALTHLISVAHEYSGVSQPAVVLVGDTNLSRQVAQELTESLQPRRMDGEPLHPPTWQNAWHVHTTDAERFGDLIFCYGCHAEAFELGIGASWNDRGISNDAHDTFGITLTFYGAGKNVRKRKQPGSHTASASQPGDDTVIPCVVHSCA